MMFFYVKLAAFHLIWQPTMQELLPNLVSQLYRLMSTQDIDALALTCRRMSELRWNFFFQVSQSHRMTKNAVLLRKIIDASPKLKVAWENPIQLAYPRLLKVLSDANVILDSIIQDDPDCDYKLAAICGLEKTVED